MGIFCFFVGVLAVAAVTADDSCPSASSITPCTCDGEGVNCMKATTIDQLRKAFRANYKYGGVRSVWIQGTPLTSLPSDTFGDFKTQNLYIEINNITSIDMTAFNKFGHILQTLSCFGNLLPTFNYTSISKFPQLGALNLGRNRLTSIPANAFPSHSLGSLILSQNDISSIGPNAFSGLHNLQRLDLVLCKLSTLGPYSISLKTTQPVQINLAASQIFNIDNTAFEGTSAQLVTLAGNALTRLKSEVFVPLVNNIGKYGGTIDLSGNPLTCNGCDYAWVVDNKYVLQNVFHGFQCTDGRDILALTRFNIRC